MKKTKQETQTEQYQFPPLAKPNPKHHKSIIDQWGYEMIHSKGRGGNGWAIVQDIGDEYVKVVFIGKDKIGDCVTVWTGLLEPMLISGERIPLNPRIRELVMRLRDDLASGRKVAISPRIYGASEAAKLSCAE
jgi:hypothetical protein